VGVFGPSTEYCRISRPRRPTREVRGHEALENFDPCYAPSRTKYEGQRLDAPRSSPRTRQESNPFRGVSEMTSSQRETAVLRAACVFVTGVLFFNWWFLAEYQIDIPKTDDWRKLVTGPHLLPDHLDLSWLFMPSNSTVFATGRLLDYVYFAHGPGNHALYQQISLVGVLGACLLFTLQLLKRLSLPLPWHLLGILSTVYLLQARSYWGGKPALAYHQALPVVGILAILVIATGARWSGGRALLLGMIAVSSGLAYISGAVAMTALGVALVAVDLGFRRASIDTEGYANLRSKALVVLSLGILTFAVQLALVLGPTSSMPGPPLATPLDWQFWTFFLNQAARGLGDSGFDPAALPRAIVINVVLFGLLISSMALCGLRVFRGTHDSRDLHYLVIAGGILLPLLGYLAVVSAGRGNFQGHDSVIAVTRMAKARFHYWWLAPLITVAAVGPGLFAMQRPVAFKATARRWFLPLLLAGLAAVNLSNSSPWEFERFYKSVHHKHNAGVLCLRKGLRGTGPIRCPALTSRVYNIDLRGPVENAREMGLPFAREMETETEDSRKTPEASR
jgi:hypothetical protein